MHQDSLCRQPGPSIDGRDASVLSWEGAKAAIKGRTRNNAIRDADIPIRPIGAERERRIDLFTGFNVLPQIVFPATAPGFAAWSGI